MKLKLQEHGKYGIVAIVIGFIMLALIGFIPTLHTRMLLGYPTGMFILTGTVMTGLSIEVVK